MSGTDILALTVSILGLAVLLSCAWGLYDLWRAHALRELTRDLRLLRRLRDRGPRQTADLLEAGLGRPGTVYARLGRLERAGLILSKEEHHPAALTSRRRYALTLAGWRHLDRLAG